MRRNISWAALVLCATALFLIAGSRLPATDSAENQFMNEAIGSKTDTATTTVGTATALAGYAKGLVTEAGVTEIQYNDIIDVSAADWTAYQPILLVVPATGKPLADLQICLDWAKATTGFDAVATALDTLDAIVEMKVDGTNWRRVLTGTQVTASGSIAADVNGQRFAVGPVGATGQVRVKVKVSAERDDFHVPFDITYRGDAAVITYSTAVL